MTPPRWQIQPGAEGNLTKREKYAAVQRDHWNWFAKAIKDHGPYDVVLVNGDAIDGKGERSGASELITADREEQCAIAVHCIKHAAGSRAKTIVMTYGTAYHTGQDEDWESHIAQELGAKIGSHEWVDVNGVVFDLKHHIGSSSVPHGRFTAIARDALWAQLWADNEMAPESSVLVRSHVHYHVGCFDTAIKPHLRLTTPALQSMGTKYGSRRCSGIVDYGFLVFECDRGDFDWTPVIHRAAKQRATVMKA